MPEQSLRRSLEESIKDYADNLLTGREVVDAILSAIKKSLPERKPAHNYASENADDYHAYDNGFKDCLKKVSDILDAK